jgi:hypothetical protein
MFSDYLFCIEEDILIVRVVEGVAVGGVQPAAAQREGLARCLQQLTLLTKINSMFTERRQESLTQHAAINDRSNSRKFCQG